MERQKSDLPKEYLDLVTDDINEKFGLPWSEFYHAVGQVIYSYDTNRHIPVEEDKRRFLRCIDTSLKNTKKRLQSAATDRIVSQAQKKTSDILETK